MTFEGPGIKKCHWILKPQPQEPKDRGVMPSIVQGKITFNAKFNTQIINLTHLKRPWCWERLKAGGEGDDRGWDGWITSPAQWTWVWVSSGSWWWTGRPGVLQSMGSQRVRHDWTTELNWMFNKDVLDVQGLTEFTSTPFLKKLMKDMSPKWVRKPKKEKYLWFQHEREGNDSWAASLENTHAWLGQEHGDSVGKASGIK